MNKEVRICPICEGRGKVLEAFYDLKKAWSTAVPEEVTCRGCGGKGWVVV